MQSVLCHKGVEMKSLFNVINAKKVQVNKKDTAIIIGKVILVILFFVMYLQIFTQKFYIHHEVVEDDRIIVATLLFIFPSVLLFFKFDIPKVHPRTPVTNHYIRTHSFIIRTAGKFIRTDFFFFPPMRWATSLPPTLHRNKNRLIISSPPVYLRFVHEINRRTLG